MRRVTFTAQHEEPKCMTCDHVCGDLVDCSKECGPGHFWAMYRSTREEENDELPSTESRDSD